MRTSVGNRQQNEDGAQRVEESRRADRHGERGRRGVSGPLRASTAVSEGFPPGRVAGR